MAGSKLMGRSTLNCDISAQLLQLGDQLIGFLLRDAFQVVDLRLQKVYFVLLLRL